MEQNRDGGFWVTKEEAKRLTPEARRITDALLSAIAKSKGGTWDAENRKFMIS